MQLAYAAPVQQTYADPVQTYAAPEQQAYAPQCSSPMPLRCSRPMRRGAAGLGRSMNLCRSNADLRRPIAAATVRGRKVDDVPLTVAMGRHALC